MGTNRRYAAYYDRLGEERTLAGLAANGGLQTLQERELALGTELVTTDPEPKPVLAWVRFFDQAIRVRAVAIRWTTRATEISFVAGGKEYETWVWSNAVIEDHEPRPDPGKYGAPPK